jgi:transposase
MKYIQGQDRDQIQIFPVSLESSIDKTNEVRIIDAFVDSLNLEELGFKVDFTEEGRPAYHPGDLLKLYIYGYLNRIRSSRQFEKETYRNIEVMWLLRYLKPDHNTISNFRRDNPKSIKKVFRKTVEIARYFKLIGGTLLAGDSTKLRAQNSKKNNFNQKKIDRHKEYIENKLDEYEAALSESDGDQKQEIKKEIDKQLSRKEKYEKLEQTLAESGQSQISTSDPESRQMITRNNITEVAYNIQTTVDAKNNLPIDYKVTNENDSKAIKMLPRAKTILGSNDFTALYDKGYHTGSEFKIADTLGIEVMVAVPGIPSSSNAPNPLYNVEHFQYDEEKDIYICPQKHELTSNGTWYRREAARFKQYKTSKCKNCPVRPECTTSKRNGKIVQRSEYQTYIEQNKYRINENKNYYRRRQAIVEHPYGTIKRQWGFSYIITKKFIKRAESDVGFMFTAYNLRRLINIVGFEKLMEYMAVLSSFLCRIYKEILGHIKLYKHLKFLFTNPRENSNHLKKPYFCSKYRFKGGFLDSLTSRARNAARPSTLWPDSKML